MMTLPLRDALLAPEPSAAAVRGEEIRAYFERFSRRRYLRAQAGILLLFGAAILGLRAGAEHFGLFLALVVLGFPAGYWRQTRVVARMSIARRLEEAARLEALRGLSALGALLLLTAFFVLKGRVGPVGWKGVAAVSLLTVPALAFALNYAAKRLARRWDPYRME